MRKVWLASPFVVVVGGLAGCSDPQPLWADGEAADGGGDVGPDVAKRPDTGDTGTSSNPPGWPYPDTDSEFSPMVPDKTTGKVCSSDTDCDVTGNGLGHCTNKLYIVSPLNPTAVCVQIDFGGGDACDAGDGTTVPLCDGDTGICVKRGTNPSVCEALCVVDHAGNVTHACAGKNACHPSALAVDSTGKSVLFGYCQGGCADDSECPSGSVCDPIQGLCSGKTCTSDTECTKLFTKPPPGFKCVADDTGTKSHCRWAFAKKDGDLCTPGAAGLEGSTDCLCVGKAGGATDSGVCSSTCKSVAFGTENAECAAGFVCDPQLNAKNKDGEDIYDPDFKLPAGMAGYCMRACTADADCGIAGWTCTQSAGTPSKTCHPPV